MVNLISSVLHLEKLRTGNVQLQAVPIELAPLLDKCLESVTLLAEEKEVALSIQPISTSALKVVGDAFWLEQVFVNLLSNAIKFTPPKSTVSVSAQTFDDNVEVRVTDQGPGIREGEKKLIFETGTGLGLPIAKELIELQKGSIAVESTLGKGSTFVILLPRAVIQ
jgi:signal transduction histidine kinase